MKEVKREGGRKKDGREGVMISGERGSRSKEKREN